MKISRLVLATSVCASLCSLANATTYFKVADEWGTIQPNGPRTGVSGVNFLNAEGANNGSFASTATLRFYTTDIFNQANAEFGAGHWKVNSVNIVLSQNNSGFTHHGNVNLYLFSNDALQITNGADSGTPGQFSSLGVSPLKFDAAANALQTKTDASSDPNVVFGSQALVDTYTFFNSGDPEGDHGTGSWPLDVLANKDSGGTYALIDGTPADPSTIKVAAPDYGIFPPIGNPGAPNQRQDTLANFATNVARTVSNLNVAPINADLQSTSETNSALSFLIVPDAATAATYQGNVFGDDKPARIYFDIESTGPAGLGGDFNGDGKVDAGDYATWRKNDGANAALPNDNGLTTQSARYGLWRSNFALPAGSGSGVSGITVPEPTSLVLLVGAIGSLAAARRRARN